MGRNDNRQSYIYKLYTLDNNIYVASACHVT